MLSWPLPRQVDPVPLPCGEIGLISRQVHHVNQAGFGEPAPDFLDGVPREVARGVPVEGIADGRDILLRDSAPAAIGLGPIGGAGRGLPTPAIRGVRVGPRGRDSRPLRVVDPESSG